MAISEKHQLMCFNKHICVEQLELFSSFFSRKTQLRIPIDPENFTKQPFRVNESFLIENWRTNEKLKFRIIDVHVARIGDMNHYDIVKEFCPNSFEKEKMFASSTGSTFERNWVKEKWNNMYKNETKFHIENNPMVFVFDIEYLRHT